MGGRDPNPRDKASFLSYISFIWTLNIFLEDYKRKLNANNLWNPCKKHRTEEVSKRLERHWYNEIKICSKTGKRPSLMKAIFKSYWFEFSILAVVHLVYNLSDVFIRPILLEMILNFFTIPNSDINVYFQASVGMIVFSVVTKFLSTHYTFSGINLGMIIRTGCTSLIYRKSLRISLGMLRELSAGHVVNLVSNDASRFDAVVVTGNFLWSTPIIAIVVCYNVYNKVGVSAVPGLSVVLLVTYVQVIGAKFTAKYRRKIAVRTDERIRLTNEILTGIHVVKMHAWERPFYNFLQKARKIELAEIFKANMVRGFFMGFTLFTRRAAVCFTLIVYVILGQKLSSSLAYVIISYYGLIAAILSGIFVKGIQEFAETLVSIKRLENFLTLDEISTAAIAHPQKLNQTENIVANGPALLLKDVSSSWTENSSDTILTDINLEIEKGQLATIIGPVASGKTTLLHLISGEMKIQKGNVTLNGTISYASQEAWIFGGTVKENILLGQPFVKERYEQVISVCCLERDIDLFVDGDEEMVGEKGAALSGGQQARINLARAVYKEADIYLFDDPLSAVDTHVSNNIFENCFKEFLKDKTVILATHQLQFLRRVDTIILLKSGFIVDQGSFYDIMNADHDYIKSLEHGIIEKENDVNEEKQLIDLKEKIDTLPRAVLQRIASCDDSISIVSILSDIEVPPEKNRDSSFEYKGSPYMDYLKIGASFFLPFFCMLFFILAQAFANYGDYFLNTWINEEELTVYGVTKVSNDTELNSTIIDNKFSIDDSVNEDFYIGIYTALIGGLFIAAFARGFFFFAMSQRCSKKLHEALAKSVLFTDISFFNNNPTGAILNRFARDLGSTDEILPKALLDTCQVFGQVIGTVVLTGFINYYLLIPFSALALISYLLRNVLMKTSLNLKRLEGVFRSPIFTHLSSTLTGLTTIRAQKAQSFFNEDFNSHQDLHTSAVYSFQASQIGYSLLLDLISIMYLGVVIFSFYIFGDNVHGADVGLAITQTVSATSMLQWGLRSASDTTSLMTSVERILAFVGLTPEESKIESKLLPPPMWPTEGRIDFKNLSLFYKDNSPVLRKVTFTINPGEKIGIVGRTGAGKSSITQALFRFAKLEGDIFIDGINTKDIPLNIIRSRIAIIPQNPILFSGDIRTNLDPYSDYPDYVLLKTLDELEVPEFLKDNGLDTKIQDGGLNMSIGQRQLICLARAILRNSSVIVLDEATANVDPNTDALIQDIIRRKLSRCTVLTIAHRLHTIMDSDRVMVMDAGKLVEFDDPHLLLQKRKGFFYSLVQETGRVMANELITQAENRYREKQQENNKYSTDSYTML